MLSLCRAILLGTNCVLEVLLNADDKACRNESLESTPAF